MSRWFAAFALFVGLSMIGTSAARAAPPEAPPIEAYGRLPAMSNVTLSPSGERLAFVATDTEGRKLFVRTVSGQPLAVMPLATSKLRDVYWGGERFVVFTVTVTRKLFVSLPAFEVQTAFVLDLQTNTTTPIPAKANKSWDIMFRNYGVHQVNGRWYAYFSSLEQKQMLNLDVIPADYDPDLFSVELETGDITLVNRGESSTRDWLIDNGQVVAREAYVDRTGAWRITAGTGGKVLTSGEEQLGEAGFIGLGRTHGTFLLSMWAETGRAGFSELSLETGQETESFTQSGQILGTLRDRSTGLLIGYSLAGDQRRTIFFDPVHQAMIEKIGRAFAGKRPWVVSASNDRTRVVVFTDGGDDSGTYWLVDLKALRADPLGDAYPRVTPSRVGLAKRFPYKAADGTVLDGVLTLPPGREAKGLPVVVLPHGGPEGHSGIDFDWMAQAYAARGYAVFQPNFRGSRGYGKAFRDAGFGQWGRKMQTDISDGLTALAVAGVVDPRRACIVGWSYGGYAALAGVTVQNGLYRCAVSGAGISDLAMMLAEEARDTGGRNAATRYWRAFMGADQPGGMAALTALSPARLA
ncbi:MAG: S9 family peptidase, partial [Caulobacterales bacterium]|nr:S9 family peptidase [Caulobacterales bacterium]